MRGHYDQLHFVSVRWLADSFMLVCLLVWNWFHHSCTISKIAQNIAWQIILSTITRMLVYDFTLTAIIFIWTKVHERDEKLYQMKEEKLKYGGTKTMCIRNLFVFTLDRLWDNGLKWWIKKIRFILVWRAVENSQCLSWYTLLWVNLGLPNSL